MSITFFDPTLNCLEQFASDSTFVTRLLTLWSSAMLITSSGDAQDTQDTNSVCFGSLRFEVLNRMAFVLYYFCANNMLLEMTM